MADVSRYKPRAHRPDDVPLPGKCNAALKAPGVGLCRNRAGQETDHLGFGHCSLHFGNSESGRVHAQIERDATEVERQTMMLAELVEEMHLDPVHPIESLVERHDHARSLVWAIEARMARLRLEPTNGADGEALPALYGPNHLGDAVPHVLVGLLADWSDRQARYAKALLDFGVDEARVRLDRAQGAQLLEALLTAIERVGLSEDQQRELRHALADEIDPSPD